MAGFDESPISSDFKQASLRPATPTADEVAPSDLAQANEDRGSVQRVSNYRIINIPAVGSFYLPFHVLDGLRSNRTVARNKLKDHPNDAWALRTLAVHELAMGNAFGARTYIEVARSNGSGYEPESSLVMGLAYLAIGDQELADAEFERSQTTNEGFAIAQINRGMAALNVGSASQAALNFGSVVSRDPRNIVARLHLGQSYYVMRMHTLAVRQFDDVVSIDPSNALALYNRGIVLHRGLRDFGRARDSLEAVLSSRSAGAALKRKANGAMRNLDRDSQGRDNLATIGAY